MFDMWKRKECCPREGVKGGNACPSPLCQARAGRRFKVACIQGGRQMCARMASLGIYPGVEMEVLCEGCGSPCLVRVHGGTISLGHGVSDKIMVTTVT